MVEPENQEIQAQEESGDVSTADTDETSAEASAEASAEVSATEEPKTVPYERLEEVTGQLKEVKEQNELLQQQMALAKANPPPTQTSAPAFDVYKEVGLDPDDPEDMPDQKQLKQIFAYYNKVFDSRLAEVNFFQQHPDFAQLVGTPDEMAAGKYAGPLSAAIKENPALIHTITTSANPRLAAYEIAKLQSQKSKKDTGKTDDAKSAIDQAVENAARVKSAANAKGGGALSEEGRYATISDKDFLKLASEHGAIV